MSATTHAGAGPSNGDTLPAGWMFGSAEAGGADRQRDETQTSGDDGDKPAHGTGSLTLAPASPRGGVESTPMLSQQEISDRFEIQQLMVDYSTAIDQKRFDDLDRVFTPDAYIDYRVTGGIDGRFPRSRRG